MSVIFINKVSMSARIPRTDMRFLFSRAQKLFNREISKKSVSILFVPEKESRALNFKYRRKNNSTNVLSFSSLDKEELGDIVICPQVAKREAKENKIGYRWWVSYLFAHGILHLLGYDHNTKKTEEIMDKLTRKIICD